MSRRLLLALSGFAAILLLVPACGKNEPTPGTPNGGTPPAEAVVVKPQASITCGIEGGVTALAVAADGSTAIVQGNGKEKNVQIWDLNQQKKLHTFDNQSGSILPVAITADAKLAAYATYSGVSIRNVKTGAQTKLASPKGGFGFPTGLRFAAKGDLMVVAAGNHIFGWTVETGEQRFAWDAEAEVTALSGFFDNDRKIASGDQKGVVKVWDVAAGKPSQTIRAGDGKGKIQAVAVTADGKTMATAESFNEVKVWDLPAAKSVRTFGKNMPVNFLAFLQGGQLLAYTPQYNVIAIDDTQTGAARFRLEGHTKDIWALIPLAGQRVASSSRDGTIKLWELK